MFYLYQQGHTLDQIKQLFVDFLDRNSPKWFTTWLLFIEPGLYPASPDVLRQVLTATGVPKRHGWAGPYRMFSAWVGMYKYLFVSFLAHLSLLRMSF
jgi:hypothetical protein